MVAFGTHRAKHGKAVAVSIMHALLAGSFCFWAIAPSSGKGYGYSSRHEGQDDRAGKRRREDDGSLAAEPLSCCMVFMFACLVMNGMGMEGPLGHVSGISCMDSCLSSMPSGMPVLQLGSWAG